jgi:hypothetical protein
MLIFYVKMGTSKCHAMSHLLEEFLAHFSEDQTDSLIYGW